MDEQTAPQTSQPAAYQSAPAAPAKPRRSKLPMIIFACIVLIGALIAGFVAWAGRNRETTDDAFTDGHAVLMMAQDAGAVTDLRVRDNQFVHKGDVLLAIDQRNYASELGEARGALATDQAKLASAKVQLERAKLLYPAELAAAQAELDSAQAQFTNARSNAARQHNVPREATSVESIDAADAAMLQAKAAVENAKAKVAQSDVVGQNIAIAAASVDELQGDVLSAQAKLAAAEVDFSNTTVVAPTDGWITKKNVEIGSFVQPGSQLFQIVTPDVFVTANFKEAQLTRMRAGDLVRIKVDAYPDLKLRGHVDSFQLGTGSRFTAFPAENATGNFVKIVQRLPVKIVIDSGLDPSQPLPLGLSVDPTVELR